MQLTESGSVKSTDFELIPLIQGRQLVRAPPLAGFAGLQPLLERGLTMRIAYVATDEVDHDLVAQVAAEYGAVVIARLPNDPPQDGLFDAVLYNLDDVPGDARYALLEGLRRDKPAHPRAVHGHDITDEQAWTLNRHGVTVERRLHRDFLHSVCSPRLGNASRLSHRRTPRRILHGSTWSSSTRDRVAGPAT